MRSTRKLTIRREVLTDLAVSELRAVAGAEAPAPATLPVGECVSDKLNCQSSLRPCISHGCAV